MSARDCVVIEHEFGKVCNYCFSITFHLTFVLYNRCKDIARFCLPYLLCESGRDRYVLHFLYFFLFWIPVGHCGGTVPLEVVVSVWWQISLVCYSTCLLNTSIIKSYLLNSPGVF